MSCTRNISLYAYKSYNSYEILYKALYALSLLKQSFVWMLSYELSEYLLCNGVSLRKFCKRR